MHRQEVLALAVSLSVGAVTHAGALCCLVTAGAFCVAQAGSGAPPSRLITSMGVGVNPSTHKAYAVDEPNGSVVVMNGNSGTTRRVNVGVNPISLAIDRTADKIYVANTGSGNVSVIDGASDKVVATIPGEAHPYAIAVNEVTGTVYVTNTYSNAVTVIDVRTDTAHPLNVGSADGVAIDSRNNTIFLTTYEDPEIRIVNGATGAVRRVKVGPHIWGMFFDGGSGTLYLGHTGTAEIVALSEKTLAVRTIPVGQIPCALAVNPHSQRLYAVNYGDQSLSVIDLRTQRAIATLPVGDHPQAVAVDPERNLVYVASVHGNNVTAIDDNNNSVRETITAGQNPYAVTVDEQTGQVYTANYGSPALTQVTVPRR